MGIQAGSMKPQKTHRKWSKFPFEQQVGIKLAAGGCHSPELDDQPRLAVECWEILLADVSCSSCPWHHQQGQHWVLAFVMSLPWLIKVQEILLFVNCSSSFLHPVFIMYVTSGQLHVCCPKKHVASLCVKGMTFVHLWFAKYNLQKVSWTAA